MHPTARRIAGRVGHHLVAIFGLKGQGVPRSAMTRSGCAIGGVLLLFLLLRRPEAAVIGAFFTNFLCLADRADHLITRLWIQLLGAVLFAGLGALGLLLAGKIGLILLAVFVVAQIAGHVHGTTPGLESLPRYGLCCLIVTAFIPLGSRSTAEAVLVGSLVSAITVAVDDYVHNGRRGAFIKRVRLETNYPGPVFSLLYGFAAVGGLVAGLLAGGMRPYWVTLTTIIVMQPDRRANTVRALQRFFGTLAGVVAAFCIVQVVPESWRDGAFVLLAFALPWAWPLGYEHNYGLGVAILSTWVLILIDFASPSRDLVVALFFTRLSDTAIGCAIALAASFFFFETRQSMAAANNAIRPQEPGRSD